MRTPKQIFCNHRWEFITRNSIVNEVLEQCTKCKVYKVWHRGINAEYKTKKFPTNKGWEPVRKEAGVDKNHRAEMERAIAEMIVELLDKESAGWSNVGISINPERIKTVVMDVKRSGVAICSHRDNPDTLTGVYVALSKATGRKLPDWIYMVTNHDQ